MDFRRLLKALMIRGVEAVASIALVLVAFIACLSILVYSFPHGSGLGELARLEQFSTLDQGGRGFSLDLRSSDDWQGEPFIASLTRVVRTVKDKPWDAIGWTASSRGAMLGERHAVQALSRSSATISFDGDSRISLDENSLIIIRGLERNRKTSEKRASLIVLEGALRGTIRSGGGASTSLEVQTSRTTARLLPAAEGTTTAFSLNIADDKSSTLSLEEGIAEIETPSGTVVLQANHAITIQASGEAGTPVRLPARPRIIGPVRDSQVVYRSQSPRMRFEWADDPLSDRYLLEIAKDRSFDRLVHRERLREANFIHGNLEPGNYYWRVRGLRGYAEGPQSRTGRIRLEQDTVAPGLQVSFPKGLQKEDRFLLTGLTDPGSRVFITDKRIQIDASGEFAHRLHLRRGANVIVVESIDGAGNIAYRSEIVHAKF